MDLNAEQKKIAVQEPKGHFLLKGVAGSGKTSVGIYRIAFLLNNYCFGKDDAILVATYNQKEYSSFAFIADTAQSIYAQSWLGTGRSFASVGFNMVGRSHSLSKNFRTTTQISQAAYSLIENCREIVEDENFVKPSLIDRQGQYPVLKRFPDETSQAEFICREIRQLLDTHPEKDIAVQIYEQGRPTPLIFIETKSPGHSLEDGLDQVKSYMSHCKVCRYGVATNGNDVVVVDHEFKPLDDIPKFRNTMLSASLKNYSYLNFKTRRKYNLAIDQNDPGSLEVSNENASQIVGKNDINSLPVYDRIAAGEPLEMNPVLEDTFYFPKQWHRGADHFILKVRGDSMRNAGIEDNDYVVIRSQAVPENLDIAVVAIDNSATLKRFSRMGSNILLLADNPQYDPIMLNEDQVSILGVAVGLVKQIN